MMARVDVSGLPARRVTFTDVNGARAGSIFAVRSP